MKLKHFYLLLFCLIIKIKFSLGQISFLPLDEVNIYSPIATYLSENDHLFTLHSTEGIGFRNAHLNLKKWNGQFWIEYPSIETYGFVKSYDNQFSTTIHNGEPYFAGSFSKNGTNERGILKFNGSKWVDVSGGIESNYLIHNEISIFDLFSYKNELFVAGQFNRVGGKSIENFSVLKGGTWQEININHGGVNDLFALNDTLFACGSFTEMDGVVSSNIAFYLNGSWHKASSPGFSEWIGMSSFGSNLILCSSSEVFLKSSTSWLKLSNNWNYTIQRFFGFAEYEGHLYAAGVFKNSNGKLSYLLAWDGNSWSELIKESDIQFIKEPLLFIHLQKDALILSGNFKQLFGKDVLNFVRLYPGKTIVSGRVFMDNDQDCAYTPDESLLENIILQLDGGGYTSTNALGEYSMVLPANSISNINIYSDQTLESNCLGNSISIKTSLSDSDITLNIPLRLKQGPVVPELEIYSAKGFNARHGYVSHYTLACNAKDEYFPMEISLQFDAGLQLESSSLYPFESSTGQYTWILDKNEKINLAFLVDANHFKRGDSLLFNVNASTISVNEFKIKPKKLQQLVVSAFDPNEKQCDKLEINENEKDLNYYIGFQNLGNDSAVQVHIVDTISRDLPIQFIQMKEYSERHKNKVSYKVRDHAIIWTFKDINLPAKQFSGDELSSGNLSFKAALANGLKVGTVLKNKAYIYFDFQDAIVTNEVNTTIVEDPFNQGPSVSNTGLRVYPNPSMEGNFKIELNDYFIKNITVYDLCGKLLYQQKNSNATNTMDLTLNHIQQGLYILNITHTVGSVSQKIIIGK